MSSTPVHKGWMDVHHSYLMSNGHYDADANTVSEKRCSVASWGFMCETMDWICCWHNTLLWISIDNKSGSIMWLPIWFIRYYWTDVVVDIPSSSILWGIRFILETSLINCIQPTTTTTTTKAAPHQSNKKTSCHYYTSI